MAAEVPKEIRLEIGHVLFIDIVGYSKLLIDDQRDLQHRLNQIVRQTNQFRAAETADKLVRLPTGDGMALVFFTDPETPVQCALEITEALQRETVFEGRPSLRVRMGINTGPVSGVSDVNDRSNIAGAGINIAQRVMDVGDAGHILLSKRAAEDLTQYRRWESQLHDLGEIEVKHGVKISVINLYTDQLGNRDLPEKLKDFHRTKATVRRRKRLVVLAGIITAIGLPVATMTLLHRRASNLGAALAAIPSKSIAVLPFQNLSANQENSFFADGVQDEILTNLARIADLKVISRTSVMQYKETAKRNLREIAGALGAAHVLEGSVQRAANRVRINAQLIDARTDAHLWAETYDRDLADIFAIQTEIAKTIADQLQARLSPSEKSAIERMPTADLGAYDLYLRAQALYADTTDSTRAREKLPECVRLLQEAVSRDPRFVAAWCLLSNAHGTAYYQGLDHTPDRLQKAKDAADAALRIDPESGPAHLANALYYYRGFRDFPKARAELAIARQTLPNNPEVLFFSGVFDYRQGNWATATRSLERAVELDPRNFFYLQQMALCYQPQRRYAEELRMWERALSIQPADAVSRICVAAVASNSRGDTKPYQTTLTALISEDPDGGRALDDPYYALRERTAEAAARLLRNYVPQGAWGIDYPRSYWAGVIARWQNDDAKALAEFGSARLEVEKILEEQPDFPAALSLLGLIDAGLGRKDEAIREGQRACALLPMVKDAVDGVAYAVNLAQIFAWAGEKTRAIEQLQAALKVPNDCHYGELRLHPNWDPLRGDPRFETIVEEAKKPIAPK